MELATKPLYQISEENSSRQIESAMFWPFLNWSIVVIYLILNRSFSQQKPTLNSSALKFVDQTRFGECLWNAELDNLLWKSIHCQSYLNMASAHTVCGEGEKNQNQCRPSQNKEKKKDQSTLKGKNGAGKRALSESYFSINDTHTSLLPFDEWRKDTLKKEGQEEADIKSRNRKRIGSQSAGIDVNDQLIDSFDTEGDIGSMFDESNTQDRISYDNEEIFNLNNNEIKPQFNHTIEPDIKQSTGPVKTISNVPVNKQYLAELTNYASLDCAASILKANPEAKGTSALLSESKDFYMLNKCAAEKFVVVELCEDILINSFVIANFEFFSSTFKDLRVSVSNRYPPTKENPWKILGEFKAKNSREMQLFKVENPLIWTRYLRIDFLTHYGQQKYCPISLLRVHGTSMIEEYKKEEEEHILRGDETSSNDQQDIQSANKTGDNLIDDLRQYLKAEEENYNKKPQKESLDLNLTWNLDQNSRPKSKISTSESLNLIGLSTNQLFMPDNSISSSPAPDIYSVFEYQVSPIHDNLAKKSHYRIPSNSLMTEKMRYCLENQCLPYYIKYEPKFSDPISLPYEKMESRPYQAEKEKISKRSIPIPSIPNFNEQKAPPTILNTGVAKWDFQGLSNYPASGSLNIFQKIMKRLSFLENNATNSRIYMEQQHNFLKNLANRIQSSESQMMTIINDLNKTFNQLAQTEKNTKNIVASVENIVEQHQNEIKLLKSDFQKLHQELVLVERIGLIILVIVLLTALSLLHSNYRLFGLRARLYIRGKFPKVTDSERAKNLTNHVDFKCFNLKSQKEPQSLWSTKPRSPKFHIRKTRSPLVRPIRRLTQVPI
ncbi:hypothetical protein G9A89_011011 [Geosiphon pyriformis]|nr:hypothetical protein G9A89_011011 [Geosiphon pyriformis]